MNNNKLLIICMILCVVGILKISNPIVGNLISSGEYIEPPYTVNLG